MVVLIIKIESIKEKIMRVYRYVPGAGTIFNNGRFFWRKIEGEKEDCMARYILNIVMYFSIRLLLHCYFFWEIKQI